MPESPLLALFDIRPSDSEGRTLGSGWLAQGPRTEAFERRRRLRVRLPRRRRRDDHLAAGPHANRQVREVQRRGAARQRDDVTNAEIFRELPHDSDSLRCLLGPGPLPDTEQAARSEGEGLSQLG